MANEKLIVEIEAIASRVMHDPSKIYSLIDGISLDEASDAQSVVNMLRQQHPNSFRHSSPISGTAHDWTPAQLENEWNHPGRSPQPPKSQVLPTGDAKNWSSEDLKRAWGS